MAHQRLRAHPTRFRFRICRYLPFRRCGFAPLGSRTAPLPFRRFPRRPLPASRAGHISGRAKAVEHVAHLLGHDLAHDLSHNSGNRIIPATDVKQVYFPGDHAIIGACFAE